MPSTKDAPEPQPVTVPACRLLHAGAAFAGVARHSADASALGRTADGPAHDFDWANHPAIQKVVRTGLAIGARAETVSEASRRLKTRTPVQRMKAARRANHGAYEGGPVIHHRIFCFPPPITSSVLYTSSTAARPNRPTRYRVSKALLSSRLHVQREVRSGRRLQRLEIEKARRRGRSVVIVKPDLLRGDVAVDPRGGYPESVR